MMQATVSLNLLLAALVSILSVSKAIATESLHREFRLENKPLLVNVPLPEGNYNIALTVRDAQQPCDLTVKGESRRLLIEKLHVKPGEVQICTITINVRNSSIANDGQVKLNDRERASPTWDDKLSLELHSTGSCACSIDIAPAPAPDCITVFIAGDSTVTDQRSEPWAGWGQLLPRFFKPGVAVANHAESGRSLRSFKSEKRLDKVLSQVKKGDYLFIQFGHNDMKESGEGVGPFTSFADSLRHYITEARKRDAIPVLLTPMNRRRFDSSGKITNTHGDYPEAVRRVAGEMNVPVIDLHAMSKTLYEAWGPEDSKKAFVHYPAHTFPNQDQPLKDDSHFNAYGAYELARCVVEGIRQNKLPLAQSIMEDVPAFDPAHPDPMDQIQIPPSPFTSTTAPAGK